MIRYIVHSVFFWCSYFSIPRYIPFPTIRYIPYRPFDDTFYHDSTTDIRLLSIPFHSIPFHHHSIPFDSVHFIHLPFYHCSRYHSDSFHSTCFYLHTDDPILHSTFHSRVGGTAFWITYRYRYFHNFVTLLITPDDYHFYGDTTVHSDSVFYDTIPLLHLHFVLFCSISTIRFHFVLLHSFICSTTFCCSTIQWYTCVTISVLFPLLPTYLPLHFPFIRPTVFWSTHDYIPTFRWPTTDFPVVLFISRYFCVHCWYSCFPLFLPVFLPIRCIWWVFVVTIHSVPDTSLRWRYILPFDTVVIHSFGDTLFPCIWRYILRPFHSCVFYIVPFHTLIVIPVHCPYRFHAGDTFTLRFWFLHSSTLFGDADRWSVYHSILIVRHSGRSPFHLLHTYLLLLFFPVPFLHYDHCSYILIHWFYHRYISFIRWCPLFVVLTLFSFVDSRFPFVTLTLFSFGPLFWYGISFYHILHLFALHSLPFILCSCSWPDAVHSTITLIIPRLHSIHSTGDRPGHLFVDHSVVVLILLLHSI